jgi:enterobactin synthetase component F
VCSSDLVERSLAAIWSELLGVDRIGRHDDFFALGGHSLLATRILARVQESLGSRLTLREVFDSPTIAKMAARIEAVVVPVNNEEREEMEF